MSPSTSRSPSPVLRDQGSSLYHRKVANTAEGGKRSAEPAKDGDRAGSRGVDSADSEDSGSSVGSAGGKRRNGESMMGGSCDRGDGNTDLSDRARNDDCKENGAVEEREEACQDPIPDVSAEETGENNELTESNVSDSFDTALRVFLVCLLISLLYFSLPLYAFIFLLLAVFSFLLYGKQTEKLFS